MDSNKIDKLKKQRDVINARIQKMEALEKTRERKRETRRKILIGAYYLEESRKNGNYDELIQKLNGFLKRNSDRVLFDLEPLNQ